METPNVDEVRETLARIQKDGNRAADVIGRVRALARKAPVQKDGLNINDVIADVIALTRGELDRSRVLLHIDLADGLPAVSGDKVQLQQVVLNLIVNAIEAMRESERRHLMIASQEDPEGHIRVSVRDSGGGLKPESIDQIFKSFFTTKSGGMGMGLSICRSIIEMHGGRLFAGTNAPHDGATFEFALPSQAHSFVAQPPPVARENPRQAIP
jgi:signal transduction histidine kinase